jgi:peroxiredoxin
MRQKTLPVALTLLAALAMLAPSAGAARVGEPAPAFTGTDTNGRAHQLSDFRGKYVVLEWQNRGCPYTHKHYVTGNMQRLQKEWTSRGVVWLTIISSAPGKQGYMTAAQANDYFRENNAAPTAVLLDPEGTIGHIYDAKTTPEIYIINPQGTLIYQGAIDDQPTPSPASVKNAKNYLELALTEAMAGKPVSIPATRPYGCSVKYPN